MCTTARTLFGVSFRVAFLFALPFLLSLSFLLSYLSSQLFLSSHYLSPLSDLPQKQTPATSEREQRQAAAPVTAAAHLGASADTIKDVLFKVRENLECGGTKKKPLLSNSSLGRTSALLPLVFVLISGRMRRFASCIE